MITFRDILARLSDFTQHYPLVLAGSVFVWFFSNRYFTSLRKLPGPFLASCTRLPRFLAVLGGRPHEWELALHRKYGKIVRTGPDLVSVGDPAAINLIYNASDKFKKVSVSSAPGSERKTAVTLTWI